MPVTDFCGKTPPQVETVAPPVVRQLGWMGHYNNATRTVNANEATSLAALVSYVACVGNIHEFRVERMLADHFNVPNIKRISSDHFESAVHFLMALVPSDTRDGF